MNRELILNTIKSHKDELDQYGIKSIGLFGSYIRDEQTPQSDIDILIDFMTEEENYENFMAVYDYIEKLFRDQKIEIVTKNGLSPYIGPEILKEVVYA